MKTLTLTLTLTLILTLLPDPSHTHPATSCIPPLLTSLATYQATSPPPSSSLLTHQTPRGVPTPADNTWKAAVSSARSCLSAYLSLAPPSATTCIPSSTIDAAVTYGILGLLHPQARSDASHILLTLRSRLASPNACTESHPVSTPLSHSLYDDYANKEGSTAVRDTTDHPVYGKRNSIARLDAIRGYLHEYMTPTQTQTAKELLAAAAYAASSPSACFYCYDFFHARPEGYVGRSLENPQPFSHYAIPMAKMFIFRSGLEILARTVLQDAQNLLRDIDAMLPQPEAAGEAVDAANDPSPVASSNDVVWSGFAAVDSAQDMTVNAASSLSANDRAFVHLSHVLSNFERDVLIRYYDQGVVDRFVVKEDTVQGRRSAKSDRLGFFLNVALVPLAENVLGRPVAPSYSFYSDYVRDPELRTHRHVLKPHTDREDNQFTFSIQLEITKRQPDAPGMSYWPLYVDVQETLPPRAAWRDLPADENLRAIYLVSGDGLFFQGRQHIHLRKAEMFDHLERCTNIILHYVPSEFDLAHYKVRQQRDPTL